MKELCEEFKDITGYDLETYFNDYIYFIENQKESIVNFYSGIIENIPSSSIDELDRLIKENSNIDELFYFNQSNFQTSDFVDLIDVIGDIKFKLLTIKNYAKWSRSSITDNRYNSNIEVDVVLNQNQTLEQLSKNIGYLESDDDWVDLALRNSVKEEDYTSQGLLKLKASLQNNLKININSVVDVIFGESIYGMDIQKKFEFEDDDLKTLSYKDTINQAFEIAINLRKGNNPEFPNEGLQSSLIVGQNLNSILYPSIFRQLFMTFASDDTFKSVTIMDIKQESSTTNSLKDSVSLKIQANTRIDETITASILI